MNTLEQTPDFGVEMFDINVAFQEAIQGVATDTELMLEEKVRRMEVIVTESSSDMYRDFVDFGAMAAQMEMFCNHDHAFNQAAQSSETLNDFMDSFKAIDGHDHTEHSHDKKIDNEDDEVDPKTGKKKKRRSWFGALLK